MEVVLASAEGWSEAAQQAALDAVQQGMSACNRLPAVYDFVTIAGRT